MRRIILIAAALCLVFPAASVLAQHAGDSHASCEYCGMDRQKFAHTAMMIEYEDGTMCATCSIHCAAINLAVNIDKTPKLVEVGDYISRKPINAETACWTIGGDVPGVMTKRAKWAFANKADCDKFAAEHGAKTTTFDEAMKAAYEDMYADTKMIRDKRKAMKAKSGQTEHKHQ